MLIPEQIICAIRSLREKNIYVGKTVIQKVLFFASQERDLIYTPYLYGPYSEEVQLTLQSMIKKGIISYDFDKGFNIELSTDLPESQRIKKVVDFLANNQYQERNKIALLSKVFYFYSKNSDKSENEIKNIIKNKGIFIWGELGELDDDNLEKLLKDSIELYHRLLQLNEIPA